MGLEIFNFWWFWASEKWFFTAKLSIKHERQENSARCFGKNISNHLMKFLQYWIKPWRVGPIDVSTGHQFFKINSLAKVL